MTHDRYTPAGEDGSLVTAEAPDVPARVLYAAVLVALLVLGVGVRLLTGNKHLIGIHAGLHVAANASDLPGFLRPTRHRAVVIPALNADVWRQGVAAHRGGAPLR